MKIFLLGGTDLSLAVGRRLVSDNFDLSGVVHLGRSISISYSKDGVHNYRHSDIAQWCDENGFDNQQFESNQQVITFANEVGGDFLLVAGWYHMVPAALRRLFKMGSAGLHASLLPNLRGGAPLPWAILSGADRTGVSMFSITDETDAGELYGQRVVEIGPRTSVTELVAAVEGASIALVSECLSAVMNGTMKLIPQSGVPTFSLQRTPDDGHIDWRCPAERIDRLVRAVAKPYPGAFSDLQGRRVTIWKSDVSEYPVYGAPGQIARLPKEADPVVVTGYGQLIVRAAEMDGEDAMPLLRSSSNKRFGP
jgi:methionyl-tRNA formyltransferase